MHVIGRRATEFVHGGAIMHLNGTVDTIDMVFNYLSLAEAYKYAAYDRLGRLAKHQLEGFRTQPSSATSGATAQAGSIRSSYNSNEIFMSPRSCP